MNVQLTALAGKVPEHATPVVIVYSAEFEVVASVIEYASPRTKDSDIVFAVTAPE